MSDRPCVGIVGGGILGLGAAYRLSQAGVAVSLYERSNDLGGLVGASSVVAAEQPALEPPVSGLAQGTGQAVPLVRLDPRDAVPRAGGVVEAAGLLERLPRPLDREEVAAGGAEQGRPRGAEGE